MNDSEARRLRSALPLRPRDYLILLALAGGPLHGYRLIQEIESLTSGGVLMDPANLHRALKRLVRDSLVDDLGREDAGQGRRRVFEITSRGLRLARLEAARLEELSSVARARLLSPESEGSS